MRDIIEVQSYFDGEREVTKGPWLICREAGQIVTIAHGSAGQNVIPPVFRQEGVARKSAVFASPGLVEAHAHFFLDGGMLDTAARADYLKSSAEQMLTTARQNLAASLSAGISLIRDAGDRYGINHQIRAYAAATDGNPRVRSPGLGLRRKGRYGSFMAYEVEHDNDIAPIVAQIAREGANDCKILLTGIIDFASGTVKGPPQFDIPALSSLIAAAHEHGLATFAHCSGTSGLEVAAAAGVGSVEHGFFMTDDVLSMMAEKQIAWVPTFAPVHFQWSQPQWCGWDQTARDSMRRILDDHARMLVKGHEKGVPIMVGSDAGSHGVPHGIGFIDEMLLMAKGGLPMNALLTAATATPRQLWGEPAQRLQPGESPDIALFGDSPFTDPAALRHSAGLLLASAQSETVP
ncbi:MAG: amidohydrolase family protein [Rhizobiales bacterium]|nr:amidohydrolase family protein [Hyphomicrobiales bacterium]